MGNKIITIIVFGGMLFSAIYLHQNLIDYSRCYNLLQTVTSEKSIYPPFQVE